MPVAPDLLAAYEATDYVVHAAPDIVARPGEISAAVDDLLAGLGVTCAAVITAWNPFSTETIPAENAVAQARLLARVGELGLRWLPAEGCGRDGDWPAEESLCVFGIDGEAARALAVEFRQNAILWLELGRAPRVIVTAK